MYADRHRINNEAYLTIDADRVDHEWSSQSRIRVNMASRARLVLVNNLIREVDIAPYKIGLTDSSCPSPTRSQIPLASLGRQKLL
jgi:hypothetical protein